MDGKKTKPLKSMNGIGSGLPCRPVSCAARFLIHVHPVCRGGVTYGSVYCVWEA